MAKIVVTHPIFPEVEQRLRSSEQVVINGHDAAWSRDELAAHLRDADAMLAFMTDQVNEELLSGSRRLKVIACALKGYDNFDADACTRAGVWLTVAPDLLTIPTAELAVALTLGLNRHLLAGDAWVRSGRFEGWRPQLYGYGLQDANVGIAGLGRVGLAVAKRLQGFGAKLSGFDERAVADAAGHGVSLIGWDELIEQSDVIILALPLNEHTFHIIDARSLGRMQRGARLVNIGRGSVVDEAAVAQSLQNDHLAGYAADVFEMEDWARADRPRSISPRLLALRDRTLFTPHLGSAVRATRLAIEHAAADAIIAVLSGRSPENAVNLIAPSDGETNAAADMG
jgi:phosphonate dehydrogenase